MVDRVVRVQLVGDATSLVQAANQASSALRGIGSSSQGAGSAASQGAGQAQSAWERFKASVAGQVAIGDLISKGVEGAFGLLKEGISQTLQLGMSYEQSMNTLQAVTAATDTEMAQLSDRAKQLGNDITIPGASASSAAEAMRELAKGGLNVQQTMQAAAGTLRLAAAAQIDAGRAAEIQANALNAFRLGAGQADHVADLLANAANAASGEITDMASSLQQSATVAAGFGISIDDTTTTLALFAKNGVLGSDAGTSFKTMLTGLASPTQAQAKALDALGLTVYDATGKFVGMASVTDQLAWAKKRLTVEEYNAAASTAFGTDAIRAANILGAEGVQGWTDMASAVGKAGGAQELAAAQSQGLTGAIDRFKNSAENTALTLYQGLSPALQSVTDFGTTAFGWLGDAVGWLTDLPAPIWAGVTAFGAMLLLKGPLTGFALAIKGEMLALKLQLQSVQLQAAASGTSMGTMGAAMRLAGISARAFGASLKAAFLSNPIGLAVAAVTTALSFMVSTTDEAAHTTADFSQAIDENTGALKENAPAVVAKALADSGSLDAAEKAGVAIGDYTQAVLGNADAQAKIKGALEGSAVELLKQNGNYEKVQQQAQRAKMGTDDYIASLLSSGDANRGAEVGLGDLTAAYSNLASDTGQMETQQRQTNQAIEGAKAAAGDAAPNMSNLAGATADAAKAATPFADALKSLKSSASEADSATQFLIGSLERLTDGSISAETMQRENEAAMRAVVASARDMADAQDTVSEKQERLTELTNHLGSELNGQVVTQQMVDAAARDLADAQDGVSDASDRQFDALGKLAQNAIEMTSAAYNAKAAQGDYKGATADATTTMEEQRKKFIDTVTQINGNNIPAAEELANKYGLIPGNVNTTFTQEGLPSALTEVERLRKAIADLPDSKIVKVAVESGDIVYTTENGAKFKATGGPITGPGGPRDDRAGLFHLSDGEFVSTAETASHPGNRQVLDWMHAGGVFPGMKDGGLVDVNNILTSVSNGNLVDTGWQSALDKAATEKARKFAESGMFGLRQAFLNAVASKMGSAYVWGAAGPDVFDCSGLVSWALTQIGAGVGRLTAQGFNAGFPHVGMPGKPGDLATFDTGRLPGQAGHIGVIMDPAKGLMMHTDGAGPARVSDYKSRDGGPLSIVDVLTGKGAPAIGFGGPNGGVGDLPASVGGGGINQWVGTVLQALAMTGQPASYSAYVLNQMRTESSGNPFAINNYDSNAARGTPSKGLMQVIDPTFRSYALPGFNTNIYDPLSNILASIRYVLARYGSIPAGMQGHAYDNGGVLPPGFTMAYNGTGQNEQVFTRGQMSDIGSTIAAAVERALSSGSSTGHSASQASGIQVGQINNYSQGDVIGQLDWFRARSG